MRYVILIITISMLFMGYSIQQLETRLNQMQTTSSVKLTKDDTFNQFLALIERLAVLEHTKQESNIDK